MGLSCIHIWGLIFGILCICSVKHAFAEKLNDDFDFEIEYDGAQNPGRQIFGIERPLQNLGSILSRETPTREIVIKIKEGVDPRSIAEQHGLNFVRCLGLEKTLCLLTQLESEKREVRETVMELRDNPTIQWVEPQVKRYYAKFQTPLLTPYTTNPLWRYSWHFNNTFSGFETEDVNIMPAWDAGWSGYGIHIGVVDDSVEWQHPDLITNYSPETSWDFNDNDRDPSPNKSTDAHGTSVAGVALGTNNNICTLGAGFNAKLSGLRLISDAVDEFQIATALTYSNMIDIYSNSWGWAYAFAGSLSYTLQSAFTAGVTHGRSGRGFIYTWAAGNSRQDGSNANYDALINAPETIAVAAVSFRGVYSSYSNPGCALLISAPSNGDGQGIYTTDRTGSLGYSTGSCTGDFGGTSSACPLVSGIISLVLEANPSLGWRDVQWVLASSARKNDPTNSDWQKNGGGFWVNHNYGFGVIDATRAIEMARSWHNVPERESIVQSAVIQNGFIPNNSSGFVYSWTVEQDLTVEHVQIFITLSHPLLRGLTIQLTSPSGTVSRLLEPNAPVSFSSLTWTFMTTFNWGENARGKWTLRVVDFQTSDSLTGQVSTAALTVWGHQAPARLNVNTTNYCPSQLVIFSWTDPTISFLTLSSHSTRSIYVYGTTSHSEHLASGDWTASISVDPAFPVDTTYFTLHNCQSTFVSLQIIDCGKITVTWNLAPPNSTIILQETKDGVSMTVTQTPVSGSSSMTYLRPYYGNWVGKILQGSQTLSVSNVITGQLCEAPNIEVDTTQQCSESPWITIMAKNTQLGMILTTQAVSVQSQIFSTTDNSTANDPLVLSFLRPAQAGSWSVRVIYGTQVFAQTNFQVSLCADPELWVDLNHTCSSGVVLHYKYAPEGSYVAIVPASSLWVSAYAATNGNEGSSTFNLTNGEYEAYLVTSSFQALVETEDFKVDCRAVAPVPVLSVLGTTSTTALLSWTSLANFGVTAYNIALSKDGFNWKYGVVYLQNRATLSRLTPLTIYYASVQGDGEDEWSEVVSFSTTS